MRDNILDLTVSDSERECKKQQQPTKNTGTNRWQPFYTNKTLMDHSAGAENCLSLEDLLFVAGETVAIERITMLTFVLDLEWLLETCPILMCVPLLMLHGGNQKMRGIELDTIVSSPVDMGIERYGSHHNKILLVFYSCGVRVVITTANFIETDFTSKVQAIYVQDFPKKRNNAKQTSLSSASSSQSCQFEDDLIAHLQRITPYERDAQNELAVTIAMLRDYDFRSAEVVLISSVPGRYSGPNK
jgi:tyrosyl-DNA phosphodiesterase-1